MSSTEDTLRDFLVDAIQAIAQTKLGFDDTEGNVKDYLLDYESDEDRADYLTARVDGRAKLRAWAVQVLGADTIFAQGAVTRRDYSIRVVGYYGMGKNGEGINAMIAGARKIREKIKSYGVQVSNLLDTITDGTPLEIEIIGSVEDGEKIVRGQFTYLGVKQNPDW